MMPPVLPSAALANGDAQHEPIASEAEGDDLIDVVGGTVFQSASNRAICNNEFSSVAAALAAAAGKTYHCQRCLNHGLEIPRKGHKRFCTFAVCTCEDCKLVEKRKILNRQINCDKERISASPLGNAEMAGAHGPTERKTKPRNPKCARCSVHDRDKEPPALKGHKKLCPYQKCECKKCKLVTSRRSVMATQIRLRRMQKTKRLGDSVDKGFETNSGNVSKNVSASQSTVSSPANLVRQGRVSARSSNTSTPSTNTLSGSDHASTPLSSTVQQQISSPANAFRPQVTYPIANAFQCPIVPTTTNVISVDCCNTANPQYPGGLGNVALINAAVAANSAPWLCEQACINPNVAAVAAALGSQALLSSFIQFCNAAAVNSAAATGISYGVPCAPRILTLPTTPAMVSHAVPSLNAMVAATMLPGTPTQTSAQLFTPVQQAALVQQPHALQYILSADPNQHLAPAWTVPQPITLPLPTFTLQ